MPPKTLEKENRPVVIGTHSNRTLGELLTWGKQELSLLGSYESQTNSEILLEHVTGLKRHEQYLGQAMPVSEAWIRSYESLIRRRKAREPLGYILGFAHFWEEKFVVGPGCLIPRPETEILVEGLAKTKKKSETFSLLDLGCGSGAIGIALLRRFPRAKGTFLDISKAALHYAERNIQNYDLLNRAETICADFRDCPPFRGLSLNQGTTLKWDMIAMNPPYVGESEWSSLEPEVQAEPREALVASEEGMHYYHWVAKQASQLLKPEGWLGLEVGWKQAREVAEVLRATKFFENIYVIKDLAGIERVILAQA